MSLLDDTTTLERLARLVTPGAKPARVLLYPATETSATRVAAAWGGDLYAIAPDTGSAHAIRARFPQAQVLCAALDAVRISHDSMSVAVVELPAPVSRLSFLGEAWSGPATVLRRAALALAPKGVLVALMPHDALVPDTWRAFLGWFDPLFAGRLPAQDKKAAPAIAVGRLRALSSKHHDLPMPTGDSAPVFVESLTPLATLPSPPARAVHFTATTLTWEQARAESRERGIWTDPAITAQLRPDSVWGVQPLMPLSRGHLGQLIACGAFNNAILRGPDGPVLLKGQTHTLQTEEKTTDTITTTRDAFRTTVALLNLTTGAIQTVNGADDE